MRDRPVVEVERLTIRYGRLTAVEDISLEVPQRSVYALLGRNGSGKSSTVRCLLGQQRPTAGKARAPFKGVETAQHVLKKQSVNRFGRPLVNVLIQRFQ